MVDPEKQKTEAIRGIAAVSEALNCIGAERFIDGGGDHAVAKIVVDNEMQLRSLVAFALVCLASEQ